jgi:hypothetical protein
MKVPGLIGTAQGIGTGVHVVSQVADPLGELLVSRCSSRRWRYCLSWTIE